MRELCIEVCLTAPARLSSLLPFIPLLMQAVLAALCSTDEQIVKLGMRTLEFWVDNLNPDYFAPLMQPYMVDVTRALCALLHPLPTSYGVGAMQV